MPEHTDIRTTKLELIRMITEIRSESLLADLKNFLKQAESMENFDAGTATLSENESALLMKLNEGVPEEVQLRYNELTEKSVSDTLAEDEHTELLSIIPQIESANVRRLLYITQLARLWNLSVEQAMDRLGIKAPALIHV